VGREPPTDAGDQPVVLAAGEPGCVGHALLLARA
jgi:hypothetical protein